MFVIAAIFGISDSPQHAVHQKFIPLQDYQRIIRASWHVDNVVLM